MQQPEAEGFEVFYPQEELSTYWHFMAKDMLKDEEDLEAAYLADTANESTGEQFTIVVLKLRAGCLDSIAARGRICQRVAHYGMTQYLIAGGETETFRNYLVQKVLSGERVVLVEDGVANDFGLSDLKLGRPTAASDPARMLPDWDKVHALMPGLPKEEDSLEFDRRVRMHIADTLDRGDCNGAIVVCEEPLVVASYCGDFDACLLLEFPEAVRQDYAALKLGDRLIAVNTEHSLVNYGLDHVEGAQSHGQWNNVTPFVANFMTSDSRRLEVLEQQLGEDHWRRVERSAVAAFLVIGRATRSGMPIMSNYPFFFLTDAGIDAIQKFIRDAMYPEVSAKDASLPFKPFPINKAGEFAVPRLKVFDFGLKSGVLLSIALFLNYNFWSNLWITGASLIFWGLGYHFAWFRADRSEPVHPGMGRSISEPLRGFVPQLASEQARRRLFDWWQEEKKKNLKAGPGGGPRKQTWALR